MLGLRCSGFAKNPATLRAAAGWLGGDGAAEEGDAADSEAAAGSGGGGGWGAVDGFGLDASSSLAAAADAAAAAGTGPLSPDVSTLAFALDLASAVVGTLRWTLSWHSLSSRSMPAGLQSP